MKNALQEYVDALTETLQQAGCHFWDKKLTNVGLDDQGKAYVIDLDAICLLPSPLLQPEPIELEQATSDSCLIIA